MAEIAFDGQHRAFPHPIQPLRRNNAMSPSLRSPAPGHGGDVLLGRHPSLVVAAMLD